MKSSQMILHHVISVKYTVKILSICTAVENGIHIKSILSTYYIVEV